MREFQTLLLHYFSKSDNESNHHQGAGWGSGYPRISEGARDRARWRGGTFNHNQQQLIAPSRQRAVQTTFAYLHWCRANPPSSLSTQPPSLAVAPRNEVILLPFWRVLLLPFWRVLQWLLHCNSYTLLQLVHWSRARKEKKENRTLTLEKFGFEFSLFTFHQVLVKAPKS